jgi:hypothetical protein
MQKAEEILNRLDEVRARLDATEDPDEAIAIVTELGEIAKDVESEISRAKREAEADATS